MKMFLSEIKTAALLTAWLTLLVGGLYPFVVWAAGQTLFPEQANGSLVYDHDGVVRGSRLLAQRFTAARYFHPRPSAAGAGYDAGNSAGANLGPTSAKLAAAIEAEVAAYRGENQLAADRPVPADAVTRSASGLDPHISVANARIQAERVARARGWPVERVLARVRAHTEDRDLGLFGEPRVNVLLLNLALDTETGG